MRFEEQTIMWKKKETKHTTKQILSLSRGSFVASFLLADAVFWLVSLL
jgi:hypothetical protein